MHRIGIISDTHGLLRPEVEKSLRGCERILRGGDINSPEILRALEEIAPTFAVRGRAPCAWEMPSSTDSRPFSRCFIRSHTASVSSASSSSPAAPSRGNTSGWRVISLVTSRSHTSSMSKGSWGSCAQICAWNTDWSSMSPSSSRMLSRSPHSTASMYS